MKRYEMANGSEPWDPCQELSDEFLQGLRAKIPADVNVAFEDLVDKAMSGDRVAAERILEMDRFRSFVDLRAKKLRH